MKKNKSLDFTSRKQIYYFISKHPGIHLRNLFRNLEFSEGTIKYHLKHLVKNRLVLKITEWGHTRYYTLENAKLAEIKNYQLLIDDISREIVLYLLFNLCGSQNDIANCLERDPKTIHSHIERLLKEEIIEVAISDEGIINSNFTITKEVKYSPYGKEKIYRLKDPLSIYNFLNQNNDRFPDFGATKNITEYLNWRWNVITKPGKLPTQVLHKKNHIKILVDSLYEIFPHPYHV
jgi:DNA-binding MarR family transcriptional regulator